MKKRAENILIIIVIILYLKLMTLEYNGPLELMILFIIIVTIVDHIKRTYIKIICKIVGLILFITIGTNMVFDQQYSIGKQLGYELGYKLSNMALLEINLREYANSICPYKENSHEYEGFIIGFQEGFTYEK